MIREYRNLDSDLMSANAVTAEVGCGTRTTLGLYVMLILIEL